MMEKLRFVKFSELNEWSVLSLSNNGIRYSKSYPLKSIGLFLNQITNSVKIEDSIEYKQITVKTNNGGLVLRDIKLGKDIGTKKQNKVNTGQFLMSRIDARNGAMGIVPESLSGAVVTNDFPIFDVKTNEINPQYLVLLTTTTYFKKVAQNCSSGTTNRQRIDVKKFLAQRIPLPTLEQQNKIVDSYNQCVAMAAAKEAKAKAIEREIERYLMDELGISHTKMYETNLESSFEVHEPSVEYVVNIAKKQDDETTYHWGDEIKKEYSKLQFVSFKDLDRWDYYNIKDSFISTMKKSPYSIVELGMVYDFISRSWEKKEKQFKYVEIGSVDSLNGIEYSETIQTKDAPSRATQIIRDGDLIIGTTRPYLKKFAIVGNNYDGCVCSSGFQVIAPSEKYNIRFLYEFLMSSIAVEQFEFYMTGALYPAITTKDLKKVQIPLPPLDVQNAIVAHISELKEQIKKLNKEAKELREKALKEFEKEVFEN